MPGHFCILRCHFYFYYFIFQLYQIDECRYGKQYRGGDGDPEQPPLHAPPGMIRATPIVTAAESAAHLGAGSLEEDCSDQYSGKYNLKIGEE